MCDDLTKQEILFFTVMQSHPCGIAEGQISEEMSKLAGELNWPSYLTAVPRPLSERLVEARERSMIEKFSPLRWRPDARVSAYVRYLAGRYLEKKEVREKIFGLLNDNDEVHAAE